MRFLVALALAGVALGQASYKVQLSNGRVVELPPEEYVIAAVAGEAGVFQSPEARKAMAVAVRTYAVRMRGRHSAQGFDFCSTTHCQRLVAGTRNGAAEAAAKQTAGELLWFAGRPAVTVYSQDCGGRTEAAVALWPDLATPYLRVHEDPYCVRQGRAGWSWEHPDYEAIRLALIAEGLRCPDPLLKVEIATRTGSGRAKTLMLVGTDERIQISASAFRFAVGRYLGWNKIRSEWYEISADRVAGYGRGHGVGLCQKGADRMGAEGLDYRAILRFYYPGTAVGRAAAGFEWTRLGAERVTVLTTKPNRDRPVVGLAEDALRWAEGRTERRVSGVLEVRIYPDVAAFRDATGEPGWVAARTRGLRIDVQPQADLRPLLRHEMLHALLEQQAAAGLPVWFREGLVEVLSTNGRGAIASGDVRDRADQQTAWRGYREAESKVRALVERYGEATVMGWVERGLPADVKYSSASTPAVKSR